jgi:predicted O-linked N-acetylglucosamine transferase (SPINDLY family)
MAGDRQTAEGARLFDQALRQFREGRLTDAAASLRDLLARAPTFPHARHLLAVVEASAGRPQIAIDLLTEILAADPRNSDVLNDRGEAYRQLGDFGKAIESYSAAIAARPRFTLAYRNGADAHLAAAESVENRGDREAAQRLRRAAASWLNELGALAAADTPNDAAATYREAMALDPDNADVANNLGVLLRNASRPGEAEMLLRRATTLAPTNGEMLVNLGNALADQGRLAKAEGAYSHAVMLRPDLAASVDKGRQGNFVNLQCRDDIDVAQLYEAQKAWGDRVIARVKVSARQSFANTREPERCLRIGFVSPDFRRHSVSYFFEPLLAHHDRAALDVFCYAEVARPDDVTARIKAVAPHWRSTVGHSDAEVAKMVTADAIDILIDVAGHFGGNRLPVFALRPAPVQVTWFGWPGTTGLSAIDYRFTDALADPEGAERYHVETLLRLPQGYFCWRPAADAPGVSEAPCLRRSYITFGAFHNHAKLMPTILSAWGRILRAVPEARLVVKMPTLADAVLRPRFVEQLAAVGISADRIVIKPWLNDPAKHLADYHDVDIALDAFPYHGHTTTCEALWMGVPVVTMLGERTNARVGYDILSRIGLAELVTRDIDGYVETAVALARDPVALDRLRQSMRGRVEASPLRDEAGFARQFEAALREVWRQWCVADLRRG